MYRSAKEGDENHTVLQVVSVGKGYASLYYYYLFRRRQLESYVQLNRRFEYAPLVLIGGLRCIIFFL